MIKRYFLSLALFSCSLLFAAKISEKGYWIGENVGHQFDENFSEALIKFFKDEGAGSVVDFGCGNAMYVRAILNAGIDCIGYDGNPYTEKLTGGLAKALDLSIPFELNRQFDWVLCLEVGEHIPKEFEQILFQNLHAHNREGIVLSWAVEGQKGRGHVNNQNNNYIKRKMKTYGYFNDEKAEKELRSQATLKWFKNTIMVFRKKN